MSRFVVVGGWARRGVAAMVVAAAATCATAQQTAPLYGGPPLANPAGPIAPVMTPQAMPQPPFQQLSPEEQVKLDALLRGWETASDRVKTLTCGFTLREYGGAFGGNDPYRETDQAQGEIKYGAPDKGTYHVMKSGGEYWVCDGTSIYELNEAKKEVIERRLPPELRGKAISDGPLPFVFGMTAQKIKDRYWVRQIPSNNPTEVWLEAYPKLQQDRANFIKVTVILGLEDRLPLAIELWPTADSRKTYVFSGMKTNDPWENFKNFFNPPVTPLGWKKIVEDMNAPAAAPPVANQPAAGPTPRVSILPQIFRQQ